MSVMQKIKFIPKMNVLRALSIQGKSEPYSNGTYNKYIHLSIIWEKDEMSLIPTILVGPSQIFMHATSNQCQFESNCANVPMFVSTYR